MVDRVNDPNPYRPGSAPIGNPPSQQQTEWRWRYSRWVGVMYGPIPVGVIAVTIGYLVYYTTR